MCLAVPGKIISIQGEDLNRTGRVSFSGVVKEVSLAYVPDACIDDYVIVPSRRDDLLYPMEKSLDVVSILNRDLVACANYYRGLGVSPASQV